MSRRISTEITVIRDGAPGSIGVDTVLGISIGVGIVAEAHARSGRARSIGRDSRGGWWVVVSASRFVCEAVGEALNSGAFA
jgi:hypothetical protein